MIPTFRLLNTSKFQTLIDIMIEDLLALPKSLIHLSQRDHRGTDRMVNGFTTTFANSAYHH